MGARESTARNPEEAFEQGPPDYYALLEVEENATADEIRVSCTAETCSMSNINAFEIIPMLLSIVEIVSQTCPHSSSGQKLR